MAHLFAAGVAAAVRAPRTWVAGLLNRRGRAAGTSASADPDPLAAFPSEDGATGIASAARPTEIAVPQERSSTSRTTNWLLVALAAIASASGAVAVMQLSSRSTALATPQPGTLTVQTNPAAVAIVVDGVARGVTPLTIPLAPGRHEMALGSGGERRVVPLNITTGSETSQYFEFNSAAPLDLAGKLSVVADSAGRVSVDGHPAGPAPIVVSDLAPGDHLVAIAGDAGSIEQHVKVEPGATASVAFSFAKSAAPTAGWVAIAAPFDVQMFEGEDLVGTTGAKVMLTAGRHNVRLVNDALGYIEARRIDIVAGKIASMKIEPPKGTVSANARPWADVLIDGTNVGQTPIANVSVAIGTHDVVFRHPSLGEQRQTVTITTKGPNRISADLTRK